MNSSTDQILELAERIRSYQAKGIDKTLSEQDTKRVLVEPLLEIAGWDPRDPTQVSSEERLTERPVDYSLKLAGRPKVLVECKRLSNRLAAPKDLEQALSYAAAAGVKWCVLTNGSLVRIYNSLAPEVAAKKLLAELDLAKLAIDDDSSTESMVQTLRLISPQSVESGEIDRAWDRRYIRTKIRQVVEAVLTTPDPQFINLVRRRMMERGQRLSKKETADWVKTLHITVRTKAPKPRPESKKGVSPRKRPTPRSMNYYMLPAADSEDGTPVVQNLHRWLDNGLWGLGERTAHRRSIRAGDRLCFYASGIGIVVEATAASEAFDLDPKDSPSPVGAPYGLKLGDVRWFEDAPIEITPHLRAKLDYFEGKDLSRGWAWFVQGTKHLSKHDFQLLAGQK